MSRTLRRLATSLALLCAGTSAHADEPGRMDRLLTRLGASGQVDLSHGMDWGVLPGPFYNPEMGLGIGMAAIGLYKPPDAAADTQISTLNLHGFVTTRGAIGLGVDNTTFFADDSYRFVLTGAVVNMPTSYWGVGYDRAVDDANKEGYTRREFFLQPRMLMRVRPNTYVGAGFSVQNDDATSLERGAASALATDPNGPHVFSSGVTAHFSYDTRDFLPNPYSGQALIANARCTVAGWAAIPISKRWNGPTTATTGCASAMCWPSTSMAASAGATCRGTCCRSWATTSACAATSWGSTATAT